MIKRSYLTRPSAENQQVPIRLVGPVPEFPDPDLTWVRGHSKSETDKKVGPSISLCMIVAKREIYCINIFCLLCWFFLSTSTIYLILPLNIDHVTKQFFLIFTHFLVFTKWD